MSAQCKFCLTIYHGDFCHKCSAAHKKASKLPPIGSCGSKKGSSSLDMQEGNWEEWHGGNTFSVKGYRK